MAPDDQTSSADAARGVPDTAAIQRLSIDTIRGLSMDAVQKANSGHPGTAMALAPLAYVMFNRVLRANPAEHRLARPRPLRPQRGPRVRAAVLAAAPHRL